MAMSWRVLCHNAVVAVDVEWSCNRQRSLEAKNLSTRGHRQDGSKGNGDWVAHTAMGGRAQGGGHACGAANEMATRGIAKGASGGGALAGGRWGLVALGVGGGEVRSMRWPDDGARCVGKAAMAGGAQ